MEINEKDVLDFDFSQDVLTTIADESAKILENEFYDKHFQFSYSSLSKLMWNPAVFYHLYVLKMKEEKTESHLVQGKIIHALLLEENKFNDQFIISPSSLPTGNLKLVVDKVFAHHLELQQNGDERDKLEQFDQAILDVLKDINLHQSLKTDQQRLDKILTGDAINYWDFLKTKGNKTLIDQQAYNFCKSAVDLMKTDKGLCDLIGCNTTEFDNKEVFNELALSCGINDKPFGLKGIIDNIVVDHGKKIIYINDIKTTSKDLKDFSSSVDFYSYWLQAAIYITLVGTRFFTYIHNEGYKVEFRFIVIDKMFNVYPFLVTEPTLTQWFNKLVDVLEKANWHYSQKQYDLPYEFAIGKVVL
jgi:hypothetical protein